MEDMSVYFEMVPLLGLVLLLGGEESQWPVDPEVVANEDPADLVVVPLLIKPEDGFRRVTIIQGEVKYILGSGTGNNTVEVYLVRKEHLLIISLIFILL